MKTTITIIIATIAVLSICVATSIATSYASQIYYQAPTVPLVIGGVAGGSLESFKDPNNPIECYLYSIGSGQYPNVSLSCVHL